MQQTFAAKLLMKLWKFYVTIRTTMPLFVMWAGQDDKNVSWLFQLDKVD